MWRMETAGVWFYEFEIRGSCGAHVRTLYQLYPLFSIGLWNEYSAPLSVLSPQSLGVMEENKATVDGVQYVVRTEYLLNTSLGLQVKRFYTLNSVSFLCPVYVS
jgi:hypothetical protein